MLDIKSVSLEDKTKKCLNLRDTVKKQTVSSIHLSVLNVYQVSVCYFYMQ